MSDRMKVSTAFVTLASENLETLVEFYRRLLQQDPQSYVPERYAEFVLLGLKLALFKPSQDSVAEFTGTASSMSVCLEVDDLAGEIAILTTMGYPPPGKIIYASHGQEIYAYDPAGNRLILHQSPK